MNQKSKLFHVLAPCGVVAALLIFWQISCSAFHISFHLLPKPTQIAAALGRNFIGTIFPDMLTSLRVMMIGYLIAIPLGFLIAALLSQFRFAVRMAMPVLIILMVTPMATLVSVFKLFFGVSSMVKVLIVVLQCTPVIAVNNISGFTHVPQNKIDLMKGFGCRKWESFFRVSVPNAMPEIFIGLKLGCILCTIAAMSADLSVGQGGLGYRISVSSALSATDTAYATILVAAIIGVVLYMIVSLIERRVIRWK